MSAADGADGLVIRSTANPRYRALRRLIDDARARKADARTVLEGEHLVLAWRAAGGAVADWLVRESAAATAVPSVLAVVAISDGIAPSWPRPLIVADRLLAAASSLPSPAPVLAIVETPAPPLPARLDGDLVILDRLQDPANVGAVLRTIAAAGLTRVVTTPGTAACWSPKALRAGMGGQFALAIHEGVPLTDLLSRLDVPLAATVAHAGEPIDEADLTEPIAWWFGNEGEGIDPQAQSMAQRRVTIDQSPGVESLNVAAAAAVCLFEQRRQRRQAPRRSTT